jgi:hypothetical protein
MSTHLKKLWNDYGVGGVLGAIVVMYGLYMLYRHLNSKGSFGSEMMSQERKSAYNNSSSGPQPAQESGNEVYSSIGNSTGLTSGLPTTPPTQNPTDLLPKDTNSQWSQLNPAGKGDLANISLLKSGYHIGIDTIGQTLRNPNLQLRSEPLNPQVNTGIWNQSTIEPNTMQVPFEIGQGSQ